MLFKWVGPSALLGVYKLEFVRTSAQTQDGSCGARACCHVFELLGGKWTNPPGAVGGAWDKEWDGTDCDALIKASRLLFYWSESVLELHKMGSNEVTVVSGVEVDVGLSWGWRRRWRWALAVSTTSRTVTRI